jgi:RNA polymerase sigma factor (sigma-70 family)
VSPEEPVGGGSRFPITRWSAITGFHSDDPTVRARSFETLVAAYWKPVYKYVRVKWRRSIEDAQDLTQAFFLRAMEKEFFAGYDAGKGRFRTWLRVCLDGFIANEDKAARRLKRGGDILMLPLEFKTAEGEMAAAEIPSTENLERYFDAEWTRSLFDLAIDALREECARRGKTVVYQVFERYDLDPPGDARVTYGELAAAFGIPITQVTNHLSFARREFRRLLLEKLREITVSDAEFRREARALLGGDAT